MGTSMRVHPACGLPELSAQMVLINLQTTPVDDRCALRLHARCDDVMMRVMRALDIAVPEYKRSSAEPCGPASASASSVVITGGGKKAKQLPTQQLSRAAAVSAAAADAKSSAELPATRTDSSAVAVDAKHTLLNSPALDSRTISARSTGLATESQTVTLLLQQPALELHQKW